MKVIMEFQIPEDEYELAVYLNAHAYRRALEDIRNEFRDMHEHQGIEWALEAQEILYNICDEENVEL